MVSTIPYLLFVPLLFTTPVFCFWRMLCANFQGLHRVDPIVSPGSPSSHAHSIHGGSNFGMTATYNDLMASSCTSCSVAEDKSAYWVPGLMFRHASNGTVQAVHQNGGITAYYDLLPFGDLNIQAFPAGFRMLAGDTHLRSSTETSVGIGSSEASLRQNALGFNCLHYNMNTDEPTLGRHFLPDKTFLDQNCFNGLRLEVVFPSCWNGKDLDSVDHRAHMAYSDHVIDGICPDGFPIRVPTLLYETIWDTQFFAGIPGEFVLSNGDTTGFGNHADFMNGWDVNLLQAAIKQCTNLSGNIADCPLFTLQRQTCDNFSPPKELLGENCAGPRLGLCAGIPKPTPIAEDDVVMVTETVTLLARSLPTAHKRHEHHRRRGH